MKIGTRLLFVLLPIVAAVMTLYAFWALRQREDMVISEAQQRTEAYAFAFGLALDQAFEDLEAQAVHNLVRQASLEPRIYRVHVYNTDGTILAGSDTASDESPEWPDELDRVLRDGSTVSFYAEVGDQPVFTVLREQLPCELFSNF